MAIKAETERGETVIFQGEQLLEPAKSRQLDVEMLIQQLGRLGQTQFHLESVELDSEEPVFCPVSLLNQARRTIVEQLIAQREQPPSRTIHAVDISAASSNQTAKAQSDTAAPFPEMPQMMQLHLLVRTPQQLEGALELDPASVTLDYLDLYGLRASVDRIRDNGITARVASPRILKPSEQKVVRFLLSLDCQILVRSGGLLYDLLKRRDEQELPELHGDFSLNASNQLSFKKYFELGLDRITPTHDLNAQQITDLSSLVAPDKVELILFQHLPVFHTEHCVFCRFLSDGTDNTNCGHPCEKHVISLQDGSGRRHAVLADVGCRNTVFGAEAQTGTEYMDRWMEAGFRHFRIEFVHQDAEQVVEIGNAFQGFLDKAISMQQLSDSLRSHVTQGTTDGSLFVPQDFKQLVQLGSAKN